MTLQGPSPQGFLVLKQNSPKLSISAYKSEITNLHIFTSTQHEFGLEKELVYPI